ncbi:RNA polymerase II elongation factor ELL2 [Strix uralensis]|uniref:RNA polymerase II elongation factor ELL2 n=1 Tax=Strix uralensis TaxID=36305 RepID=UPI003DA7A6BE
MGGCWSIVLLQSHGVWCGGGQKPGGNIWQAKIKADQEQQLLRDSLMPSSCSLRGFTLVILGVAVYFSFLELTPFFQIPEFDLPDELDTFNFLLSDIGNDDPQESFYCVQQMDSSSGASQLSCLGLTQNKISVCATSDSYPTTQACMTQPEEESRNGSAKFIKPGGPFLGRKAQVRKAPQKIPDPVPVRKRSTPMNPANIIRRIRTQNVVSQRPYRDRVIHLLALKNYKKPELLARLQKDGVNQKDKNCLGMILHQVASLNTKDNSYSLKDYLFKDIQKDWPGYNEIDKQSLELILSRKLNSSEDAPSTSHSGSPATPSKDSPSNSQKRVLNSSFIDPLNKKKRISRLGSGIPSPLRDRLSAFREKAAAAPPPPPRPPTTSIPAPHPLPWMRLHASHPPKNASSTSPSTPEGQGTQNLPMDSFSPNSRKACEDQQQKYTSWSSLGIPEPAGVQAKPAKSTGKKLHLLPEKAKELKEKDEGKMQDTVSVSMEEKDLRKEEIAEPSTSSCLDLGEGVEETCTASTGSPSASEPPDYFTKYTAIVSYEQRQRYKNDFYAEYDEYRNLYAQMESISQKFTSLDAQRHMLSPGSKEYKMLCKEVLEEYHKLKESSPSYSEEKRRCQYLHNKLSHIKKLIGEFDKQQEEL